MDNCIHIKKIDIKAKRDEIINFIQNYTNLIYNCSLCQIDKQVYFCMENNCLTKVCEEFRHFLEHYENNKHYIYFNIFSGEIFCVECKEILSIDYNYEMLKNEYKSINKDIISWKSDFYLTLKSLFGINDFQSEDGQINSEINTNIAQFNYNYNHNFIECSLYFLYGIKYLKKCFLKIYYNEIQLYKKTSTNVNSKLILVISKIIFQLKYKIRVDKNLIFELYKILQKDFPVLKKSSDISIHTFLNFLIGIIHKKLQTVKFNKEKIIENENINNTSLIDLYFKNYLIDDSIIIKCFNSNFKTSIYCGSCDQENNYDKNFISAKFQVLDSSKFKEVEKMRKKYKYQRNKKKRSLIQSIIIRNIL